MQFLKCTLRCQYSIVVFICIYTFHAKNRVRAQGLEKRYILLFPFNYFSEFRLAVPSRTRSTAFMRAASARLTGLLPRRLLLPPAPLLPPLRAVPFPLLAVC